MTEPHITINDVQLTKAQAITVRVAVSSLMSSLDKGLGDDEHGRTMVALYRQRLQEIQVLICRPISTSE